MPRTHANLCYVHTWLVAWTPPLSTHWSDLSQKLPEWSLAHYLGCSFLVRLTVRILSRTWAEGRVDPVTRPHVDTDNHSLTRSHL